LEAVAAALEDLA